ncbi:MAG: hypothetical protein ACRDD8_15965 [Bacteroidales bacterium]
MEIKFDANTQTMRDIVSYYLKHKLGLETEDVIITYHQYIKGTPVASYTAQIKDKTEEK